MWATELLLTLLKSALDGLPDFTENHVDWEKLAGLWSDVSSNEGLLGKRV